MILQNYRESSCNNNNGCAMIFTLQGIEEVGGSGSGYGCGFCPRVDELILAGDIYET